MATSSANTAPSLPLFVDKVNKAGVNVTELEIPWSFSDKYMVGDVEKQGVVYLDGYPKNWPVSVKWGHDWVELRRGWGVFVNEVIQNDSEAYLVVDYMGDMQFKVRAFYSDGNIVVDVPLCLSRPPGFYRGPRPEFFRQITHASERPMINAHGPFHKQLLDVGMGLFEFHLKAAPTIKTVVQVTHTNRNYIEFGTGWNTFLAASGIQSKDLVFLELVPYRRITVMAFRWEDNGPVGALLTPLPTVDAHESSSESY